MKHFRSNFVRWFFLITVMLYSISFRGSLAEGREFVKEKEYTVGKEYAEGKPYAIGSEFVKGREDAEGKLYTEVREFVECNDLYVGSKSKQYIKFEAVYDSDMQMRFISMDGATDIIDSDIYYTDHLMNLTGREAVSIDEFLGGNAILAIDYRMVKTYLNKIPLNFNQAIDDINILETASQKKEIPFYRSEDEVYWRISNKNTSVGIGVPSLEIPNIIDRLLPEKLNGVYAENIFPVTNKDVMDGTIWLYPKQTGKYEFQNITLDQLDLPDDIESKLKANGETASTLEILANYKFVIPFKVSGYEMAVSNKICFRVHIIVDHN
ncbi:MAG: hypothetical protein K0R21_2272 [Anaerocolumna sp.]|nr:hypothetical protein [Anaerocolumna sp.]